MSDFFQKNWTATEEAMQDLAVVREKLRANNDSHAIREALHLIAQDALKQRKEAV